MMRENDRVSHKLMAVMAVILIGLSGLPLSMSVNQQHVEGDVKFRGQVIEKESGFVYKVRIREILEDPSNVFSGPGIVVEVDAGWYGGIHPNAYDAQIGQYVEVYAHCWRDPPVCRLSSLAHYFLLWLPNPTSPTAITRTSTVTSYTTVYTTATTGTVTSTLTSTRTIHTTSTLITDTTRRVTETTTVTRTVYGTSTITYTTTTTITRTSTVMTTTRIQVPPPSQTSVVFKTEEINLPEGQSYDITVEGKGRALIIKVEATDRMFLLGNIIRNKYSITVYRDGQQITTLKEEVSRIDPPGDPIIHEIVVEHKSAQYRVVVKTEDIGCLPPFNWPCNGDRVRIQVLLGLYTTEWARRMAEIFQKTANLWTHPYQQFVEEVLSYIMPLTPVDYVAEVYLEEPLLRIASLVFNFPVDTIVQVIETWKNIIRAFNSFDWIRENARLVNEWDNIIYYCVREWPYEYSLEPGRPCIISGQRNVGVPDRKGLLNFYINAGYPFCDYRSMPAAGPALCGREYEYDFIKMQLGFMAWSTSKIHSMLRDGYYEEAKKYMEYNLEFRSHLNWMNRYSSGNLGLNSPWKEMYDHTRLIVLLDLLS